MRRKTKSDGRTTVYVTDRAVWERAKKVAASRKLSSVSELLFELLKKDQVRGEQARLLQTLEKWSELRHFSAGVAAFHSNLDRVELLARLNELGIGPNISASHRARTIIHRAMEHAGLAPREHVIFSRILKSQAKGLALLVEFFETPEEYRNELQLVLDELYALVGERQELRRAVEDLLESGGAPKIDTTQSLMRLRDGELEFRGPTAWFSVLLYFAGVGLSGDQLRLLREHYREGDLEQKELFGWWRSLALECEKLWTGSVGSSAFAKLWLASTRDSIAENPPPPPTGDPLTTSMASAPAEGVGVRDSLIIDSRDSAYPVELSPTITGNERQLAVVSLLTLPSHLGRKDQSSMMRLVVTERIEEIFRKGTIVPAAMAIEKSVRLEVGNLG